MDTDDRLKQIEKIAQNARTTWFGSYARIWVMAPEKAAYRGG